MAVLCGVADGLEQFAFLLGRELDGLAKLLFVLLLRLGRRRRPLPPRGLLRLLQLSRNLFVFMFQVV